MKKKRRREKPVQADIFAQLGGRADTRLFRNNRGVALHRDGSYVHYGLGNPGGSDLIGWHIIQVTPAMVGARLAVFTAIECKRPGNYPNDDQQNFINQVRAAGGYAGCATSVSEALNILDFPDTGN